MKVTFELSAGTVDNLGPNVEVLVNQSLYNNLILLEKNNIDIEIDNTIDNTIEIYHRNKSAHDTVVVNGKIVADKFVIIEKIWVDDILLPNSFCYTKHEIYYPENYLGSKNESLVSNSMYFNGKLCYSFQKNFFVWLYWYFKNIDKEYAKTHNDPEAEQKFFGYDQESPIEEEILNILKSRVNSIIS